MGQWSHLRADTLLIGVGSSSRFTVERIETEPPRVCGKRFACKDGDLLSSKHDKSPGGEALRRRLTELWNRWDLELMSLLQNDAKDESGELTKSAPFKNLDILTIISQRDYPNGRQLGQISFDAYQKALTVEAGIREKLGSLGCNVVVKIAREIASYGEARELAGYRGAQLEMLVADHVANLKTSDEGSTAKKVKADQRLKSLIDYVRENSLAQSLPGRIAADDNHQERINKKFKAAGFGVIGSKQLERELVDAFAILRAEALLPFIERLPDADRTRSALLGEQKDRLKEFLEANGLSHPRTSRQLTDAVMLALQATS